jgi:hypothetical protein
MEAMRCSMSEQQNESSRAETVTNPPLTIMYFPVSPVKLLVMSICTFGLYEIFWYYNNWCIIKEREESEIWPFARAIFAFFFCYPLFNRVRGTAESQEPGRSLAAGPLAAGWIIFTILAYLPDPFWLVSFFSVVFLVPVQATVNRINLAAHPGHDPNSTFTGWNKVGVVIGGLLLLLALVGTFLPSK